jgi:hypothetical protein
VIARDSGRLGKYAGTAKVSKSRDVGILRRRTSRETVRGGDRVFGVEMSLEC